jgi:galactose mutarotase-like enzyme
MKIADYDGIKLHRWKRGASTYLARPELGARLMNWNLRLADGSVRDIIHWPEAADFGDFAKIRGGNPILFPFSGRTYNSGEIGAWKDQEGVVRPMPQNGFVRNAAFGLVAADEEGFKAELRPDEAAREAYPFDYRFSVKYTFRELEFQVVMKLENLGSRSA